MSAMKLVDEINAAGGKITSFQSHCGGLVAPESDDNPWHYKISWNPRNIVLAGKAGAHYRENGEEKKIRYENLFDPSNRVMVPGIGNLSWYANRDSLSYTSLYGLEDAPTFVRTTLRHPDFMVGWKNVIARKLTDETVQYDSDGKSLADLFKAHFEKNKSGNGQNLDFEEENPLVQEQFSYLGINDEETPVNKGMCSAADILQFSLEKNLALRPDDRDMIVMLHELSYISNNNQSSVRSTLVVKGEDNLHTAMAKTVGLPLGIATKLILSGDIVLRGLHIPTSREIYGPVLKELEEYGICFNEERN
jgi:saccharopine dehydrogenase-like NADP-dependent oxidoreductase